MFGGHDYDGAAGNDLFIFGDVHGHADVDGGSGRSWVDTIEVQLDDGPAASLGEGGWTLQIDGQMIVDTSQHGSIDTHGQSGTIHTEHGDVSFTNIEKIEW
ncbi:MAG: hypothetical protein HQL33_05220 [Alphaproteobacteria bacterium]|nr:hypothetical protein [Alphaproteobacteria bacterium]MBF0129370.1 hypothetical protein [Alphaproteobacteria bacterium]